MKESLPNLKHRPKICLEVLNRDTAEMSRRQLANGNQESATRPRRSILIDPDQAIRLAKIWSAEQA
jgi:hypothetical protein